MIVNVSDHNMFQKLPEFFSYIQIIILHLLVVTKSNVFLKYIAALLNTINCKIQPVSWEMSKVLAGSNTFNRCLGHTSPVIK